jgi:predicted transposase/invertase (TIGR01784 family)
MTERTSHELLSLTNDYVFRRIFGQKDIGALADFLSSILDMPTEELAELYVDDPHLHREHEQGKSAELDVMVHTKRGEIINIEIQVNPEKAIGERLAYYNSRIFSGQLKHGKGYIALNRTISVIIMDFVLFDKNADCFNRFQWYNKANGTLLTTAQEINVLELPKLPQKDDGTKRWQWLKLLKLVRCRSDSSVAPPNRGAQRFSAWCSIVERGR